VATAGGELRSPERRKRTALRRTSPPSRLLLHGQVTSTEVCRRLRFKTCLRLLPLPGSTGAEASPILVRGSAVVFTISLSTSARSARRIPVEAKCAASRSWLFSADDLAAEGSQSWAES